MIPLQHKIKDPTHERLCWYPKYVLSWSQIIYIRMSGCSPPHQGFVRLLSRSQEKNLMRGAREHRIDFGKLECTILKDWLSVKIYSIIILNWDPPMVPPKSLWFETFCFILSNDYMYFCRKFVGQKTSKILEDWLQIK